MLRLRYLSWPVICAVLLSTVAPALPTHAASISAVVAPVRQDEVADLIADLRSEDPDIEDDFSDDVGLWETPYNGTTSVYYKSNELHVAVDDENTLAWSLMDDEVGDFYAEIDATHYEGRLDNQFGFIFRFDEVDNYYLFAASSDGYYSLQMNNNDEWTSILEWDASDLIETGEGSTNTLGLLVEGDTFTLLVNDNVLAEATDDTLTGTNLAINAAAFDEPPVDIGFDNFRLWHLVEPVDESHDQAPEREPERTDTPEPDDTPEGEETPESEETPEAEGTPTPDAEETPEEEPTAEATTEVTDATADDIIAAAIAEVPIYSEDFSSSESDLIFLESDGLTYTIADGVLEFAFNTPNILTWAEVPEQPNRYYIEVDVTMTSATEDAEYGIIFNYVDSQNFYLYAVNNLSRYSVWRLVNNAWEAVSDWSDAEPLLSGEGNTNRLGLLMEEDNYTLVANDEILTEFENTEAVVGGIAVAAGTYEESNVILEFDNLSLWALDENAAEVPTDEPDATGEPEETATEEATGEATVEPTDEPVSGDFGEVSTRIEEITADDPDFSDDFRRDTGFWYTTSNDFGGYFYENRALNIEAYAEDQIVWSTLYDDTEGVETAQFGDFYAEFDTSFVTLSGENSAGLVFRLIDTNNFYKVMVDEKGYFQIQKRANGEQVDLIERSLSDVADATEGAVNRIGVLAEGTTLALSINGTVVAQVEDSDLESGAFALAIQSYTIPEAHSTFDNLDLWDLSE